MEEWNIGIMGFFRNKLPFVILLFIIFSHIIPSFHYSNVPSSSFFFRAFLKNPFDLLSSLNKTGKERNLSLQKELHAGDEVRHEVFASEFVIDEHRSLMNPSSPLNALNKSLMEEVDIFLPGRNSLSNGHLS